MLLILLGIGLLVLGAALWLRERRRRRVWDSEVRLGAGSDEYLEGSAGSVADVMESLRPTRLFWNLRLNRDGTAPATAPVEVGTTYSLETAIERTSSGQYSTVDPTEVMGRAVTFEFISEGLRFRRGGSDNWVDESIVSQPFLCQHNGTPVFAVEWQAKEPGSVLITAVLAVDGQLLKQQTVRLRAVGDTFAVPVETDELWSVQGSDLVLHAIRREPFIDLTLERPRDETLPAPLSAIADEEAVALNNLVLNVRNQLELLSKKYPLTTVQEIALSDDAALKAVAHLGRGLYRAIFGVIGEGMKNRSLDELNEVLRAAPEGTRVAIDDGGAALPWGILYDANPENVDVRRFWGVRLQLSRRVVTVDADEPDQVDAPEPGSGWSRQPIVHSFINPRVLQDVFDHQEAMEGSLADHVAVEVRGRSTSDLRRWMTPGASWQSCGLLYVFAHASIQGTVSVNGVPNGRWPETNAVLDLESSDNAHVTAGLTVAQMRELRIRSDRFDPLPDHPIAFVNACSSGRPDAQCVLNPLVKLFVKRWGIPAFIGTDWATPQRFAAPFAESILTPLVEQGATVGEALWFAIRDAVIEGSNPFALNYCLYGLPDRRL